MKKYLLIILVALGACQEENEMTYSVDPALVPYVDAFYAENEGLPKNLIAELDDFKTQAISKSETIHGQHYLYFSETLFNSFKDAGMEADIQEHVDKRLKEAFRLF